MTIEQKFNYDKGGMTDANINEYQEDLGFAIEIMNGKKVLDIGGGGGRFQNEAGKRGVDVVSIDPAYDYTNLADEKKMNEYNWLNNSKRNFAAAILKEEKNGGKSWRKDGKKIAAINEALPFKANTFDFVLARNSSLYYVFSNYTDKEKVEPTEEQEWLKMGILMLEEIYRVLKPGGEARLKTTIFGEKITNKFNEMHPNVGCEFHYNLIILNKPF